MPKWRPKNSVQCSPGKLVSTFPRFFVFYYSMTSLMRITNIIAPNVNTRIRFLTIINVHQHYAYRMYSRPSQRHVTLLLRNTDGRMRSGQKHLTLKSESGVNLLLVNGQHELTTWFWSLVCYTWISSWSLAGAWTMCIRGYRRRVRGKPCGCPVIKL